MATAATYNARWSDAELAAAAEAYLAMLRMELEGLGFVKSHINRQLREGALAGRNGGAIEYRMQNFSAAMMELRMPYVSGYKPAVHIGSDDMKARLIKALRHAGADRFEAYVPTADRATFEARVSTLGHGALAVVPAGAARPTSISTTAISYVRDPAVKAWVLAAANGHCEGCGAPAPFTGMNGLPYLEVHHVQPLSAHGSDRVSNAVALCPNCHRRCHHAQDRDEFKLRLYETNARLEIEVPYFDEDSTDMTVGLD